MLMITKIYVFSVFIALLSYEILSVKPLSAKKTIEILLKTKEVS